VFRVLRDRARAHTDAGFAHAQVLVNHGRAAGASIAHPHAQVLAIGFVPPVVADAVARFGAAARDLVVDEATASADRGCGLVDGRVRAWCPWAGASPYETRVAAGDAGARFEAADDPTVDAVALVTRDVVAGIGRVLGEFAYNVVVHNAPARTDAPYHWHVTVVPRVATLAGFELGTGVLVNTLDPAAAAAHLRDALATPPAPRGPDSP
jgi:UDPglucose--hexose-1-phosphate uridylyltransferase